MRKRLLKSIIIPMFVLTIVGCSKAQDNAIVENTEQVADSNETVTEESA